MNMIRDVFEISISVYSTDGISEEDIKLFIEDWWFDDAEILVNEVYKAETKYD